MRRRPKFSINALQTVAEVLLFSSSVTPHIYIVWYNTGYFPVLKKKRFSELLPRIWGIYLCCLRKEETNSPKEVFGQTPFNFPLASVVLKRKSVPLTP